MRENSVTAEDLAVCVLVTDVAKALVDEEASVYVEIAKDSVSTTLKLHVATTDIGKVIGKQGRTARAIRTVASAAAMKLKKRYALDISEGGDLR